MPRLALHGPAEHGHGVGVVQQIGVRAVPLHVPGDVEHHRDGAQGAEDARWPAGVADVRVHAVLLGDQDVVPPDVERAGQDRDEDDISVAKRLGPVQRGLDPGWIVALGDDALRRAARKVEPLRIDVHQRQRGVLEQGESQHVPHECASESEAASADECDLRHPLCLSCRPVPAACCVRQTEAGERRLRLQSPWLSPWMNERMATMNSMGSGTDASA